MPEKSKITAVRLGELKAPLQMEAHKRDRSLHWLIKEACRKLLESSNTKSKKSGKKEED